MEDFLVYRVIPAALLVVLVGSVVAFFATVREALSRLDRGDE